MAGGQAPMVATLSEIFVTPRAEAAAARFVMAQLGARQGPILWLQERLAWMEAGRPSLAGLGGERPLWLMQLPRAVDVMTAAEEGLRCGALAGVVAEIRGNPAAVNFTALKRLALRAEAAGLPCWLIRPGAVADLSAARDRWRIGLMPSARHPDDGQAPGDARWQLELFRSRDKRPGQWVARHDRASDRLDLVAGLSDGTLAGAAGADGEPAQR